MARDLLEVPQFGFVASFYEMRLRTFAESYVGDFCIAAVILMGVAMINGISALVESPEGWAASAIDWLVFCTGSVIIGLYNLNFVAKLVMSILRAKGAAAVRFPERTGVGGYYDKHLREPVESWIADVVRCVMVLTGIGVFELFSRGLKLTGFPSDRAVVFEQIDQVAAVAVCAAVCVSAALRVARGGSLARKEDAHVR